MNAKLKKIPWCFGFDAIAVYPYIFYVKKISDNLRRHEEVHLGQQGNGHFGLLVWFFLYFLVLPIGWNPFRWEWEFQAYKEGSGLSDGSTIKILKRKYFLWFHKQEA